MSYQQAPVDNEAPDPVYPEQMLPLPSPRKTLVPSDMDVSHLVSSRRGAQKAHRPLQFPIPPEREQKQIWPGTSKKSQSPIYILLPSNATLSPGSAHQPFPNFPTGRAP